MQKLDSWRWDGLESKGVILFIYKEFKTSISVTSNLTPFHLIPKCLHFTVHFAISYLQIFGAVRAAWGIEVNTESVIIEY